MLLVVISLSLIVGVCFTRLLANHGLLIASHSSWLARSIVRDVSWRAFWWFQQIGFVSFRLFDQVQGQFCASLKSKCSTVFGARATFKVASVQIIMNGGNASEESGSNYFHANVWFLMAPVTGWGNGPFIAHNEDGSYTTAYAPKRRSIIQFQRIHCPHLKIISFVEILPFCHVCFNYLNCSNYTLALLALGSGLLGSNIIKLDDKGFLPGENVGIVRPRECSL